MALKDFLRLLFIVLCLICLVGCDLKNRYFLSYSIDKSIINLQWEGSLVGRQIIADNYSRQSLVDNWDVILAEDNPSNIEASPEKIFFNAIDHLDVTAVSNYISRGGDVDIQRNGHTALIEILIDIYLRGYHTRETTEMLEMLIDAGADINGRATGERFEHFKDQTALMIATRLKFVYSGGIETTLYIIQSLLDAGADTEVRVSGGQTVLMLISRLEDGHNWNSIDDGQTILMLISWFKDRHNWNSIDIARALLQSGADPNARDDNGWTALMHANYYSRNIFYTQTRKYNLQITEVLLEHSADPNIGSYRGITPLMLASRNGNIPVIRKLLDEEQILMQGLMKVLHLL